MFSIRKKKTQYEQPIVEQKKVKKNKAIFFSEHDKSIFNQNSFPMFIVNKNFTIEKSNVAFNSFVGKDASSLHLSLVMRSNELNEGLNSALKNKNKVNVNVIIYDQVHKYVQAQIFPIEIENETFVLIILT
jgi:nitrogen-specific signal transduction histidine kinase